LRAIVIGAAILVAGCDEEALAPRKVRPAPPAPSAPAPTAGAPPMQPKTAAGRAMSALLAQQRPSGVSISPDGGRIAYDVALDPVTAPSKRAVLVLDRRADGASPRRVTAGASDERGATFSPDGKTLAFWCKKGGDASACVADLATGSARVVASVAGSGRALRFSPDGTRLLFLQVAGAPSRHTIAAIDLATSAVSTLSPPDLFVHELAVSPDGKSFAAVASSARRPSYFKAELVVFREGEGRARALAAPRQQLGEPRFSPDGAEIAVVGGLMSDEGVTGGDLFVVPVAGGAARNLTAGRASTVRGARWMPDGRGLFIEEFVDGRVALGLVPAHGGAGEVLLEVDAALSSVELSADGSTVAFVQSSYAAPPAVWTGPLRKPARVEATAQPFDPPWGEVKVLHTPSDAYSIQSLLVAPRAPEASAKAPLVVVVHGGPASVFLPAPNDYVTLAAEGYYLLLPNPRGSFGRGAAFTAANVKDLGGGDLRDVQAAVHAALAAAPIDPARVAIMGWSYGGFMTMWAVTQSTEFRAAVAGAGIADWQSYYGQTDITGWMPGYFGASIYDDPAVYAKRSPIAFVKQVKTPTLVLVGERDVDCPAPQSRQFWAALDALGVPTELVVFPGEPHNFSVPDHRVERVDRIAAWFGTHLAAR
jgi:dipeptidyl aminopeptidase/acylaminoacyl peptidase